MLRAHVDTFDDMPDPRDDLPAWLRAFRHEPVRWRAAIERGFARMRGAPAVTPAQRASPLPPPPASALGTVCSECGRQFDTLARLRTHAANAHGYRSPLALRIYT